MNQSELPRCPNLDGSSLRIVPAYTEAGMFTEANCVTITDGVRTHVYVPAGRREFELRQNNAAMDIFTELAKMERAARGDGEGNRYVHVPVGSPEWERRMAEAFPELQDPDEPTIV